MRFPQSREFYVRPHHKLMEGDTADLTIYLGDQSGGLPACTAMVFAGKAQKPTSNYQFRSPERRAAWLAEQIESRRASLVARAKYRAERQGNNLQVGDVLESSWGYEQTNVDYYQVTAMVGRTMVEIRQIQRLSESDGALSMSGRCVPNPGVFVESAKPMRCKVQGSAVRVRSFAMAYKIEPKIVGTIKVYESSAWSSYA